jgi:hypothetical protein
VTLIHDQLDARTLVKAGTRRGLSNETPLWSAQLTHSLNSTVRRAWPVQNLLPAQPHGGNGWSSSAPLSMLLAHSPLSLESVDGKYEWPDRQRRVLVAGRAHGKTEHAQAAMSGSC